MGGVKSQEKDGRNKRVKVLDFMAFTVNLYLIQVHTAIAECLIYFHLTSCFCSLLSSFLNVLTFC